MEKTLKDPKLSNYNFVERTESAKPCVPSSAVNFAGAKASADPKFIDAELRFLHDA